MSPSSQVVQSVSRRLSLRTPQHASLSILDSVCSAIPLEKDPDLEAALAAIRANHESVESFEREFPSLCFALATGVGKTRLAGAFISYLRLAHGIRHFFVLAPNLTIYNKLIADFSPGHPKYVFQGIGEFVANPPEIITGDDYESGRGVREEMARGPVPRGLFDRSMGDLPIHVNIFNIAKINSEVRGGRSPRIRRLSEYIGESYFEYLSRLPDLVMIMDESHRYRASAGARAINELKPVLGLELTATPQVQRGQRYIPFSNVIYAYPLSRALEDGYVKQPAVATRQNFASQNYDAHALERLKLEDGVRLHEDTKLSLEVYAAETGRPVVKPFMLVVARDTTHAEAIVAMIEADDFFDGHYQGKVITVHSRTRGEERDENVQLLLDVEKQDNPVEIVVHVDMLKEGWDVTNLYTIVPLRAADSRTLVEQSIGRGLRLPYGRRTGVAAVDRLTIVAHDRFQEIVDEANREDSPLTSGFEVVYVEDEQREVVEARPILVEQVLAEPAGGQAVLLPEAGDRDLAEVVLDTLPEVAPSVQSSVELGRPENISALSALVRERAPDLAEGSSVPVEEIVQRVVAAHAERTIDIPRIVVVPKEGTEAPTKCADFDLDLAVVPALQPVADDILIQYLADTRREMLSGSDPSGAQASVEQLLAGGIAQGDSINYQENAELIHKLAGQLADHLRSRLPDEAAVRNVASYYLQRLSQLVVAQMEAHLDEEPVEYESRVSAGFLHLRESRLLAAPGQTNVNFRAPLDDATRIRRMVFSGFSKCLYAFQKFDSDPERRFAVLLEDAEDVLKWVKPGRGVLRIEMGLSDPYEPDFVVETTTSKFLCEPKRQTEIEDAQVQRKAAAAALWCQVASEHAAAAGGKPWAYALIPHDVIDLAQTFDALVAAHRVNVAP